jgi:hypothetical protein
MQAPRGWPFRHRERVPAGAHARQLLASLRTKLDRPNRFADGKLDDRGGRVVIFAVHSSVFSPPLD